MSFRQEGLPSSAKLSNLSGMPQRVIDGVALRRIRQAREMSARDLATALGVTPASVSQVENGVHGMHPSAIQLAAKHLGVRVEDITQPAEAAS